MQEMYLELVMFCDMLQMPSDVSSRWLLPSLGWYYHNEQPTRPSQLHLDEGLLLNWQINLIKYNTLITVMRNYVFLSNRLQGILFDRYRIAMCLFKLLPIGLDICNVIYRGLKKMIHFSFCNIFVNPGDAAKPNIYLVLLYLQDWRKHYRLKSVSFFLDALYMYVVKPVFKEHSNERTPSEQNPISPLFRNLWWRDICPVGTLSLRFWVATRQHAYRVHDSWSEGPGFESLVSTMWTCIPVVPNWFINCLVVCKLSMVACT